MTTADFGRFRSAAVAVGSVGRMSGDVPVLSAEEVRVLGCLLEKHLATPDVYPMTINALVAACNQSSNRMPVVSYDEQTVREALDGLRSQRLVRVVHQPGQRAPKHRHVLDEAFAADDAERAVLSVLMLRGPQTVAELRARTERLHSFSSSEDVEATLERLTRRMSSPLAVHLERQPGQKEARWAHLLAGVDAAMTSAAQATGPTSDVASGGRVSLQAQVDELRAEVVSLRDEVASLRSHLGG